MKDLGTLAYDGDAIQDAGVVCGQPNLPRGGASAHGETADGTPADDVEQVREHTLVTVQVVGRERDAAVGPGMAVQRNEAELLGVRAVAETRERDGSDLPVAVLAGGNSSSAIRYTSRARTVVSSPWRWEPTSRIAACSSRSARNRCVRICAI